MIQERCQLCFDLALIIMSIMGVHGFKYSIFKKYVINTRVVPTVEGPGGGPGGGIGGIEAYQADHQI